MDEVLILLMVVVAGLAIMVFPILLIVLINKLNSTTKEVALFNNRRRSEVSLLRNDLTKAFNQLSAEISTLKEAGKTLNESEERDISADIVDENVSDREVCADQAPATEKIITELEEKPSPGINPELTKNTAKNASTVASVIHPIHVELPNIIAKKEPEEAVTLEKEEDTYSSSKFVQVLGDIKEWLLVGDKYRAEGVSKEYAIATNWLVRIGIVISILGIAFGLRYSYTHGWVSPPVRVLISSFVGVLLSYFGLKMEGKKYELLGHGFLGGGITTLYFSVFSATHIYNLIPQTTGFVVMALVTAACGVIAVKFESKLVAILGILGGYITPVLMETNASGPGSVYLYMALLGIGVLGITTKRNWYIIRFLAFACHWLLFFLVMDNFYKSEFFTITVIALTVYFLIFAFNACVYCLAKRVTMTLVELTMLLVNTLLFTGVTAQVICDHVTDNRFVAILTISLSFFYIICSRLMLQRKHQDKGFVLSSIAMSGFFAAISLPILLDAGWLTISWSIQAFFMLWLSRRLSSNFIKLFSYGLYIITAISLLSTCSMIYSPAQQSIYIQLSGKDYIYQLLLNLIQVGIPVLSFILARLMLNKDIELSALSVDQSVDITDSSLPTSSTISFVLRLVSIAVVFSVLFLETRAFFTNFCLILKAPVLTVIIGALVIYFISQLKSDKSDFYTTVLCIAMLALVAKTVIYDPAVIWKLNENFIYFVQPYSFKVAFVRLLNLTLCLSVLIVFLRGVKRNSLHGSISCTALVIALIVPFFALSVEINTLLGAKLPGLQAGGISIFWSVYAISLLLAGIRRQERKLRYAGLILFVVVTVKVFTVDLINLGEFWKILAFIILGVIILAGSWMYIKFQHLFVVEKEEE